MNSDRLYDLAASVSTRHDFVSFIKCLKGEVRHHANQVENDDLNSFLDGLAGFAQDMEDIHHSNRQPVDSEVVTWRVVAQMMLAATVYE